MGENPLELGGHDFKCRRELFLHGAINLRHYILQRIAGRGQIGELRRIKLAALTRFFVLLNRLLGNIRKARDFRQ